MPTLASQQVADRVVALLLAAPTTAGSNVSSDRFHPVSAYPTIKVLHTGEDIGADDDGDDITWPAIRLHRLALDVRAEVQASVDLDVAMSAIALEILQALEGTQAAATLAPLPGCTLRSTGLFLQTTPEGQAANGQATVRLEVLFRTRADDPSTLI